MENRQRKPSVANGMLMVWLVVLGIWCAVSGYMFEFLVCTGAGLGTMLLIETFVRLLKPRKEK